MQTQIQLIKVLKEGKDGIKEVTYKKIKYQNEVEIEKTVI